MKLVGKSFLYQSNFPSRMAGLLSNVYYTVYNYDGTIYTPRTQIGVVEYEGGAYGVKLSFSNEGSWSIHWDIDGYDRYVANEEINIYDDSVTYSGYGY